MQSTRLFVTASVVWLSMSLTVDRPSEAFNGLRYMYVRMEVKY